MSPGASTAARAVSDDQTVGTVKDFTTPTKDSRPTVEFTIDGDKVRAVQPKGAFLLDLAALSASASELEQSRVITLFVDKVFDADSKALIHDRLNDDDDDFDVDDLTPVIHWLQELWTGRPTGPPSASRRRSQKSGRRSTARAR